MPERYRLSRGLLLAGDRPVVDLDAIGEHLAIDDERTLHKVGVLMLQAYQVGGHRQRPLLDGWADLLTVYQARCLHLERDLEQLAGQTTPPNRCRRPHHADFGEMLAHCSLCGYRLRCGRWSHDCPNSQCPDFCGRCLSCNEINAECACP